MRDQSHDLLARAAAGDTTAFRALFDAHRDSLFRLAYHLTGSVDAAEDVVHDCFLGLIGHAERFDAGRGSLRQYLYGMVRNLARQRWRAEGRWVSWDDAEEAGIGTDEPLDSALRGEISDAVHAAIGELPVLQREAVVLFEFEGLSLEEIAAVAGCDAGTVKSRLYRARERLRRALAPYAKGVSHESAQ